MIEFTGHKLDAVVVLTVDDDEIVAAAAPAGPGRGPRRRHRGRHPAPPGGLRRADRAADRGLPRARHPGRGRRHGRGRRRHPAHLRRAGRRSRELTGVHRGLPRPRHRDQDARADRGHAQGRPGGRADPRAARGRRSAPAITTGELDAIAEDNIRSSGATPSFKGYHGFPGSICASVNDEVVHGIPGERVLARRRRHLHRLRRDRRRLARRRGDHGGRRRRTRRGDRADARSPRRRCGAGSPPPASAAGSPTSRTPSRASLRSRGRYGILEDYVGHGIGSEMHQPPNVPNYRPPGPRPEAGRRAWPWPSSRWSRSGARRPTLLDDDWTVVTADGSWAAHFEHTFTLTPDGAWVLTALDGGESHARRARRPFRRS